MDEQCTIRQTVNIVNRLLYKRSNIASNSVSFQLSNTAESTSLRLENSIAIFSWHSFVGVCKMRCHFECQNTKCGCHVISSPGSSRNSKWQAYFSRLMEFCIVYPIWWDFVFLLFHVNLFFCSLPLQSIHVTRDRYF